MIKALAFVFAAVWAIAGSASAADYGYPIDDPFLATVVGTPRPLRATPPENIPFRDRSMVIFENRVVPEFLWFDRELRYSQALQRGPAPLVFIIAGTGGSSSGGTNTFMARAFYEAGFHIVSLSSPTVMNFVVAGSKSSVPGHAFEDAEDIYRIMERIWDKLKTRIEVTDFFVTGYSLGAFNSAFVSLLDEEKQVFNFKKVLLINPPVRLYSSISLLDRMLQNIPGGVENFAAFYKELVEQLTRAWQQSSAVEIGEDFLYEAFEAVNPNNEELAALIGVAFRITSANMTFTSDVMTDFGYIKPKNVVLGRNSSAESFMDVAHRLGFTDFFHAFFYPYFREQYPGTSRADLIGQMSLTTIEDYLQRSEKIEVMHNQDDIILESGEIDFFPRVFGERAKIYPRGGHLGNLQFVENATHMVNVFKQ